MKINKINKINKNKTNETLVSVSIRQEAQSQACPVTCVPPVLEWFPLSQASSLPNWPDVPLAPLASCLGPEFRERALEEENEKGYDVRSSLGWVPGNKNK